MGRGGLGVITETQKPGVIRVVIADDHALVRDGIRRMLEESAGIEVVGEAADGEEAAQKVSDLHPDVVLMDIAMPRVNGVEATRRIKAQSPSTAVVVLTAYDDDIYVSTLLEAGAAGYLLKDVHASDLISALRAIQAGEAVLSPAVVRRMLAHFGTEQKPASRLAEQEDLTSQERLVLLMAARGLSNKAIAQEMSLSPRTVQSHLAHIFNKLGVASRTEAVVMSIKQGWLRTEDIG